MLGNLSVGSNSRVTGSLESGGRLTIDSQARIEASVFSRGNVQLKNGSEVLGDISSAGRVQVHRNASVGGQISENISVPQIPGLLFPVIGRSLPGLDVELARGEVLALDPGEYGILRLRQNATIQLQSGQYLFQSIDLGERAIIEAALGSQYLVMNVVESFTAGNRSEIRATALGGTEAEKNILIQVQGNQVALGQDGSFLGTFIAPNAHVQLRSKAELNGALFGKSIRLGPQTKVQVDAATELMRLMAPSWLLPESRNHRLAKIELRDSRGDLVTNSEALVEFQPNSTGPYLPFGDGILDADGSESMEVSPESHRFRISYRGANQTLRQDVVENQQVIFRTSTVSLVFRNSLGELMTHSGASIIYQPSSAADYVPFGDGILDVSGEEEDELLPGRYRFRLGYHGAEETIQQEVGIDPIVSFHTVSALVELRNSLGTLIEESSALIAWQPGATGEVRSFGDGILDDGGAEGLEVLGVKHRFGLVYDGAVQTVVQDFGIDSTLTFQTVLVTVELRDSVGSLIENSQATVAWKPRGTAAFQDFSGGALDFDGTGKQEVLAGKHRFRIGYGGSIETIQQDVLENRLVLFQASDSTNDPGVRIELRDSIGNLIPNSGATVEYQPNSSGQYIAFGNGALDSAGTASMNLSPQQSRFRLSYQGASETIRQHVGDNPVVVFQTVPVVVSLLDSNGDFIVDAEGTIEYQPGRMGDYLPFDGGNLESGLAGPMELLGVKHRFRLIYDGATKTLTEDIAEEALVLFQTVLVSVELRDQHGDLEPNSGALVQWRPAGGSGFEEFGPGILGADGTVQHEAIAGNHRFRMITDGETKTKVQNTSEDSVVVFAPDFGLEPAAVNRMIDASVSLTIEGGDVSLRIQGQPFTVATLERSMDLEHWRPIRSFQFNRAGIQLLVDSESTRSNLSFYRVIIGETLEPIPTAASFVAE